MKTLIGALLAVTALSPTLASAQRGMQAGAQVVREDDGRDGPARGMRGTLDGRADRPRFARDGGQDRPDRPVDASRDAPRPGERWADRGSRGSDRADPRGEDRPDQRQAREQGRYGDPRARDDWTRSRLDRRDDGWTRSRFADRSQWNRGWRGDDRYDWNGYRTAHRGAYRLPRYDAPGRDRYRRFAIGTGLDASLWNRAYWIADPYAYRLPQAYGPYRWVRYYDDALLVDQRGGRVVDAVYGIFW